MNLVVTIETKAGNTGLFMVAYGQPENEMERALSAAVEQVVADFMADLGGRVNAKQPGGIVSGHGEEQTRLLHKEFQVGQIPPAKPEEN